MPAWRKVDANPNLPRGAVDRDAYAACGLEQLHRAQQLTITVGKNAGKSPSVASLYGPWRKLRPPQQTTAYRRGPSVSASASPEREPLTAEEIGLRERLQAKRHPNAELR